MSRASDPSRRLRESAARALGLELDAAEVDRLARFVALLATWSHKMNLVSYQTTDELVDRHVVDSLAAAAALRSSRRIVDFGSGAGLPGIPLAIVLADSVVHLVEARRRRATFLRAVVRELRIANLVVEDGRGEARAASLRALHPDAVVSRAVPAADLLAFAEEVLSPGGRLLWMRKASRADQPVPGPFDTAAPIAYELPGGARHEVSIFVRR